MRSSPALGPITRHPVHTASGHELSGRKRASRCAIALAADTTLACASAMAATWVRRRRSGCRRESACKRTDPGQPASGAGWPLAWRCGHRPPHRGRCRSGRRNCVETDVARLLPTGAEVLLVRPTLAVLPAPRLWDSYNPRRCRPGRASRPRPAAQDERAKASCRSPSTRSCIGITGAVDRCEHRRPRCRDRLIQACAASARHDCSALPPARAALSQCHALSRRVAGGRTTAWPG